MATEDHSKMVTCKDRNGQVFEVPACELVLRPAVYAVIIRDEKVLLVHQWDGYDFPGGGIDLGEDLDTALTREISEETGLEVKRGEVVACENAFYKTQDGRYLHSLPIYFKAEVVGGELSLDGLTDLEKGWTSDLPEWIPLSKIKKIKFYNSVDSHDIIRKAQEKNNDG